MKDLQINSNTNIFVKGKEKYLAGKSKKAVLLIHGYTGIPHEMYFLGEKLHHHTNFSVYIPRLPGHGTNAQDFRNTNAKDWLRKTYDSYLNLKSEYQEIYVIGLSMGGLLAILTAARFAVKKLVTISAALYTRNKLIYSTPLLKYILPVLKQKNGEERIENANTKSEKSYHKQYHKYHYTGQIAEFTKIMRLTRKKLSDIATPALILGSKEDELVPIKAAQEIYKSISSNKKEISTYYKSPHVICNGPEKEKCASEIIDFIEK